MHVTAYQTIKHNLKHVIKHCLLTHAPMLESGHPENIFSVPQVLKTKSSNHSQTAKEDSKQQQTLKIHHPEFISK